MNSNLCICRNEVYVEDEYVGQFESFDLRTDSRTLGNSATLTIPLYALVGTGSGEARTKVRSAFISNVIKPTAEIKVYCWYEGEEKTLVFNGFIEHVGEGFPTKLHLRDNSYILRFGAVQKVWDENATLATVVKDCIPVANEGFKRERETFGFTRELPDLTYTADSRNVQAVTSSLSFRNWAERSPYDTIQKLMQLLVLYGGVTDDYNVYIGAGTEDTSRPVIPLDTRYNVVERDIVPVDGRFVDYDVKVTGILSNGRQYTATAGYATSRSNTTKTEFEKSYGEKFRAFTTLSTQQGIQDFADRQLAMLKGFRNKGTIKCVLYPKCNLLDQVQYNDTLFPELGGLYYILEYRFSADASGYFQYLSVTDRIFML